VVDLQRLDAPDMLTLKGEVFHVQGLDLDGDAIYITSVDRKSHRGYLHKFSAAGALLGVLDITDGARYHPGGIALDEDSIWIPVAEYRAGSTTRILQVDKQSLKTVSSFIVDDHIGAVASRDGKVYGDNWSAHHLYIWDHAGRTLARPLNTTQIAYQDFKFAEDDLIASGISRDAQSGAIDWLDPETLLPRRHLPVGKMANGIVWTREGMAVADGKLYLLPNDGHDGQAEIYVFDLESLKSAALECTATSINVDGCGRRAPLLAQK
jgi:hypothetical protein